jgi:methionyl aminopeptidase
MIAIKSPEEIAILRQAGALLGNILTGLKAITKAGITSLELENEARRLTEEAGAVPAFLGYTPHGADRPYPAALCLSINDVVVHGIPNENVVTIKEGDIVVLDMGITYKGLIVDSAITVGVGQVDEKAAKLLQAGEECLNAAIEALKHWPTDFPAGIKSGDVGHVIEKTLEHYRKTYGFSFADGLGGHGVGHSVHEDPFMPNIGKRGQGPVLKPGLVIAVEPIVNEGKPDIYVDEDGYTIRTEDGKRSVHFEHTIVITETGAEVLTERK